MHGSNEGALAKYATKNQTSEDQITGEPIMSDLKFEFLMSSEATLKPGLDIGNGAMGHRGIADVTGGTFEGPRLKGTIVPSGADWYLLNPTLGILNLDVRATLQTDDGANIFTQYKGRITAPPEQFATLFDRSNGLPDPSSYYFRTAPLFETGSEKYSWLNGIVAVGVGHISENGVGYEIYEIK
jgi:hypothetical protein